MLLPFDFDRIPEDLTRVKLFDFHKKNRGPQPNNDFWTVYISDNIRSAENRFGRWQYIYSTGYFSEQMR